MTFEEVIKTNGKLAYTNVGRSMMPLIREGKDVMMIEEINKPLRINDAVLFIRPQVQGRGRYVLHRIRKIYEDGTFFIIGDNCVSGERVQREQIIGILTELKRGKNTIRSANFTYKLYVKLWWFLFPLRKTWRKIRSVFGKIKRRLI